MSVHYCPVTTVVSRCRVGMFLCSYVSLDICVANTVKRVGYSRHPRHVVRCWQLTI